MGEKFLIYRVIIFIPFECLLNLLKLAVCTIFTIWSGGNDLAVSRKISLEYKGNSLALPELVPELKTKHLGRPGKRTFDSA